LSSARDKTDADMARRGTSLPLLQRPHHAALPARLRQILCGALHQAAAGIGDNELHAIEPTINQVA
jgi:hypothetical protein